MDGSTRLVTASTGLSRDQFIHQAHEARQARELSRHHEHATNVIQAFFKAILIRKRLKYDAIEQVKTLTHQTGFTEEPSVLLVLRRFFFFCSPSKEKGIIDELFTFILSTSELSLVDNLDDNQISHTVQLSTLNVSDESPISEKPRYTSLFKVIASGVAENQKLEEPWSLIINKILNIASLYLRTRTNDMSEYRHDMYLQIVNLFTSRYSKEIIKPSLKTDQWKALEGILLAVISKFEDQKLIIFERVTGIIRERFTRLRDENKSNLLQNYTQIGLDFMQGCKNDKKVSVVIQMFCIPGYIQYLEKYCPKLIEKLSRGPNFSEIFEPLLESTEIQKLSSTSSVCLLANLVHLADLSDEALENSMMDFVDLVLVLLVGCQKNMSKAQSHDVRKKNNAMNVSFNPLLGWLAREPACNVDKDLLKTQISHLWATKFINTLFKNLTKFIETQTARSQKGSCNSKNDSFPNLLTKTRGMSVNQNASGNPYSLTATANIFRRVVERATNSMSKSIISTSYVKTACSIAQPGSSKLLTNEVNQISMICFMYYEALNTLATLKQDILTGLSLHHHILPNLWMFIRTIGPHNGLRAFLEHLAMTSKSSVPEFYILFLFCECASHLISILDDSELYEKQQPFNLDELIDISSFLNHFVFCILNNSLLPISENEIDPLVKVTHKLLTDLYKRDCRRKFCPKDHWLIKELKLSIFLKDLDAGKPVAKTILNLLPHILPHKERVLVFRKLVAKDKAQYCSGPSTFITIHRQRVVEDGYQQLVRLKPHALKGSIRVKFINSLGLDEAGVDQDGVFKEFLEDTIKKVFDPALNLFCTTSEQHLYPSPTSRMHDDYLSLFEFVGKMLGKALYEGIVVDVPFATFFLSRVLGQHQSPLYSPIDELPSLDPELYKSLTYIKHYDGNISDLDLTFSIDQDFMGEIETYELEPGGKSIPVTRESRVRYIHSVANFRMKTQIEKQTEAFVNGFKSIINPDWLSMFSASEFQRLISGDTAPIDLQDLRRNTKYLGGFHNNHRVICWLWDVLEKDFTPEEHSLFLKFVTSCSKPPLLGFANLEPSFSIRCVEVGDDQDIGDTVASVLRGFLAIRRSDPVDRLPTSSTCFNMLKLPNYQRRGTLRDKLRYAVRSNPGFELS